MRALYSLALMGALLGGCAYQQSDKTVSEAASEVSLADSVKTVVAADDLDGLKALVEAHTLSVLDLALRDSEMKACTVLELVCLLGKEECADYLLNTLKVNPNYLGRSGWAPIHRAAVGGYQEVVALLIQAGANINIRDMTDKMTALSRVSSDDANLGVLRTLLDAEADPEIGNWFGYRPLAEAAVVMQSKNMAALVNHKADVNHIDNYGETALYGAVCSGHAGNIAYLLANGAKPTLSGAKSCICTAAQQGDYRAVQLLLAYGANPEEKAQNGRTALQLAPNQEILTLLEGYAAKKALYENVIQVLEKDGEVALVELLHENKLSKLDALACELGTNWNVASEPAIANLQALASKKRAMKCEALIAKEAERNPSPYKRMLKSEEFSLLGASAAGDLKHVQELLLVATDPSQAITDGTSALQAAILCGNTGVTAYLLANLSPEKRSEALSVPLLQSACERGLMNEIKLLLAYGAKSDISQEGFSAEVREVVNQFSERKGLADKLKKCLKDDDQKGLKNLIDAKGLAMCNNVLSEFKDIAGGSSVLHLAVWARAVDCVRYLGGVAGADLNRACDTWVPLALLVAQENEQEVARREKILTLLLQAGANIDAADVNGFSALYNAVYAQDMWLSRSLLEKGANAKICDMYGASPVLTAVGWRYGPILDALCDPKYKGQVDVNSETQNGYSPLLLAATYGSSSMVGTLLKAGARTYSERYPQNVPLIHAVRFGNYECVRLLLEHGADRALQDDAGKTALDYAREIPGNTRLVALLESP